MASLDPTSTKGSAETPQFQKDHERDMGDPEYAEAYREAERKVTAARVRVRFTDPICGADITIRDEEHRLVLCEKAPGHTDAHEGEGVIWTDADHA